MQDLMNANLKRNLRLFREYHGHLTQRQAARKCRLGYARYQQLESGFFSATAIEISMLAKGFGVSVAFLLARLELTVRTPSTKRIRTTVAALAR
jgi:transcriptional regulator with XRE-family HTH domain